MNKSVFFSALKVLMNSADCYPSYASYRATLSFSITLYSCSIDWKAQFSVDQSLVGSIELCDFKNVNSTHKVFMVLCMQAKGI